MKSWEDKREPVNGDLPQPVQRGEAGAALDRPVVGGVALTVQRKEKANGLPDDLRTGIENLSGYAMDDVRVHYNSEKPQQLNALAYAQGTEIHVAPGQEQHLPHEAWHVVQQAQGRVRPTMQLRGHTHVNDDCGLEHEADVMGAKALQAARSSSTTGAVPTASLAPPRTGGVKQLMSKKKSGAAINTLVELNAAIKEANIKGGAVTLEALDDAEARAVDAAIAASVLKVDGATTRNAILSEIKTKMASAKPTKGKSALELRKEAAKACPSYNREYYGGKADEPHVHVYGQDFHLKMPDRYDIVKNGQLKTSNLRDARGALKADAAKKHLHAAIDKALLERGMELDTY